MATVLGCGDHTVDMIIKLGGSAITCKDELERAKTAEIGRAVQAVAEAHKAGRTCIIVHGAGSFGHHHAKQYSVNQGVSRDMTPQQLQQLRLGFCKTRLSVTKPCGQWQTNKCKVQRDNVAVVLELLSAGYIPVLHGDCVLDKTRGCCILSGDTIIQELCVSFRPAQVIFLTDVLGIYDKPPDQTGAILIPEVHVRSDGNIDIPVITSVHKDDVTGGIQLKLMSAIDIVCHSQGGTRVYICGVDSEAARTMCVHGELRGAPATCIMYAADNVVPVEVSSTS